MNLLKPILCFAFRLDPVKQFNTPAGGRKGWGSFLNNFTFGKPWGYSLRNKGCNGYAFLRDHSGLNGFKQCYKTWLRINTYSKQNKVLIINMVIFNLYT